MAAKPKVVPRLVIIEGKDKGKIIPLSDGTAVIGRTKGDVVIRDSRVSRSHVAVHFDAKTGNLTFTDLKSLNGTFINGETVESGDLKDGDQLQLGNTIFDCQLGEPVDEESSVSKVRDQMRRRRESEEKEAQASAGEALEPDLPILGEEEPQFQEPQIVARASESEKREKPSRFEKVKKIASSRRERPKLSRLTRVAVFMLLIGGALYVMMDPPAGEDTQMQTQLEQVKTLASSGDVDGALTLAKKLSEQFPNSSQPYMILGLLNTLKENKEEAIRNYQLAKDKKPYQPLVHGKLIELYIKTGLKKQVAAEVDAIDNLIREGKHSKELFLETGRLLMTYPEEIGKPPEDYLILGKAIEKQYDANNPLAYKLQAQSLLDTKQTPEAITLLEKVLVLNPKDEQAMEKLVFAKLSAQDIPGSKNILNQWLAVNPMASKALLVLAYLGFNESPDNALPPLQRIMENAKKNPTDPHLPEAVFLMGQVLYRKNQIPPAIQMFEQACQGGYQPACKMETALRNQGAPPTQEGNIPQREAATPATPDSEPALPGSNPKKN